METFPRYWPFVRGIHRSPVNSPHKGPVTRGFDVFFDLHLNKQLSNAGDLGRHCAHYDVIVIIRIHGQLRHQASPWPIL